MAATRTEFDQLSSLTILEASDLAKALEEKWGVSAAAAMAVATASASAGKSNASSREEAGFDVVLTSDGGKKINVIKEVRAITKLGLGEAKALVDAAPTVVREGISRTEALEAKQRLEKAGGTVEVVGDEEELSSEEMHDALMAGVRRYTEQSLGRPSDHLAYLRQQMRRATEVVGA